MKRVDEDVDDYYIEPVAFVARSGELSEAEIEAIHEAAREAVARIGTGDERRGSGGIECPDRRAVKLAIAVDEAMGTSE